MPGPAPKEADDVVRKDWRIVAFPEDTKNQLLGHCKAKSIDWKDLLDELITDYLETQK